jgi:hypothetical protein
MPPSLADLEAALADLEVELRLVRVDGHWEARIPVLVRSRDLFATAAAADRRRSGAGAPRSEEDGASEASSAWDFVPDRGGPGAPPGFAPRTPPVPGDEEPEFSSLPGDVRLLAPRLRDVAGWTAQRRICRAVQCGRGDSWVLEGDGRYPPPVARVDLPVNYYVVLRTAYGGGPFLATSYGEYASAVRDPARANLFAAQAVSRGFASQTEALAYCWGAGLPLALPPRWAP